MNPTIALLPDHLINQIAAGEVIENSASVIKELVENSLDAGASKIEIEIKAGGMLLISVGDDGSGMGKEDLKMCLKRHATSKIKNFTDLQKLFTMGFRGEALSSIASVGKVRIESSYEGEAHLLTSEGGEEISLEPSSRIKGTKVEVKSLFFNVPVRKKFQRGTSQLAAEITKTVTSLALCNPLVGFLYVSDEKRIIDVKRPLSKSFKEAIEERASALLGSSILSGMHFIDFKEGMLHLEGLLGEPSLAKKNRTGQYLFLNSRSIFSHVISEGIKEGYGTRIAERDYPIFVLHISVDPTLVDVNVHPQKRYVRLLHELELRVSLQKAVSLSFSGKSEPKAFDKELNFFPEESLSVGRLSNPQKRYLDYENAFEKYKQDSLFSSFRTLENEENKRLEVNILSFIGPYCLIMEPHMLRRDREIKEKTLNSAPLNKDLTSYEGEETKSAGESILAIDLKAAAAAVFFEKALLAFKIKEKIVERQKLNIPIVLDLMPFEMALLENNLEKISSLGFDIRIIGSSSIAIDSCPSFFRKEDLPDYINALLQEISLFGRSESRISFLEKKLAQKICKVAKSRKVNYSVEEAKKLIEALFSLSNPSFDPLGENIIVRIEREDLDRLFATKSGVKCHI